MLHERLKKLQQKLIEQHLSSAFISKKEHIFYLSGLAPLHPTEREAFFIITPAAVELYHSPFVIPPPHPFIKTISMSPQKPLSKILKTYWKKGDSIGIEKQNLTVQELEHCQQIMPNSSFVAIDSTLHQLRLVKDITEIDSIKKACEITSNIIKWVQNITCDSASIGITEQQLEHLISEQIFLHHVVPAFPTIVAFDTHTASPHHIPSTRKLKPNSIVLVDMGVMVNGYASDMTRTWAVTKTPAKQFLQLESIVMDAYQAAYSQSQRPKRTGANIDRAARQVIKKAGYGDYFIHTTGHGVGLEAHELPHISNQGTETIPPRAIITIEPGIYIPGKFGYRFEDTFLMTKTGAERLTR